MMIWLAFLLPLLIGLVLCLLLATRLGHAWVLAFMAPGLGMGVTSVLFFLWSLVFYPRFQTGLYLALEIALLAGLGAALWRNRKRLDLHLARPKLGWWEGLLGFALAAGLIFFAYAFLKQTAENPLGGSDAWTIWNYRARFLLLGDAQTWRNVFSRDVAHADYPYLLTGFIARCWVLIGKDRTSVPVITAGLFTLSTVGLLGALVARLRGLGAGLLAALLLLSLPVFAWTCATQYADLPLAFYFLAALVLLYRYAAEGHPADEDHPADNAYPADDPHPWALIAAGGMAGLALWTKNEGASFALALVAATAGWQITRRAGWRGALRQMGWLIAGLLPLLLLYLGYRTWLVPPTDLFENRSSGALLQQLTDWRRYWSILQAQGGMLLSFGWWKLPYLPCLAGYMLIAGVRRLPQPERRAAWLLAAVLGLTFLQYLAVFVITPFDLVWQMATTNARLYNQLLPGLLLMVFLVTRSERS